MPVSPSKTLKPRRSLLSVMSLSSPIQYEPLSTSKLVSCARVTLGCDKVDGLHELNGFTDVGGLDMLTLRPYRHGPRRARKDGKGPAPHQPSSIPVRDRYLSTSAFVIFLLARAFRLLVGGHKRDDGDARPCPLLSMLVGSPDQFK